VALATTWERHAAALPDLRRNIANARRQLEKEFAGGPRLAALEKRAQRLNDLMAWQSSGTGTSKATSDGLAPEAIPAALALLTDSADVVEILGPLASESGVIEDRPPPGSLCNVSPDGTPLPRKNSWLRRRQAAESPVVSPEVMPSSVQVRRPNPNLSQVFQVGGQRGGTEHQGDIVLFTVQQTTPGQWVVYAAGGQDPLARHDSREDGEQWALRRAGERATRVRPGPRCWNTRS
jgi:hypothetical protein